jgi:hypothetical protein
MEGWFEGMMDGMREGWNVGIPNKKICVICLII